MTLYATRARNAELTRLKFSDVDKQRMIINIQGGKGRKDRDVMLSSQLLEELREHWYLLAHLSDVGIDVLAQEPFMHTLARLGISKN
jgi:integrase